MSVGERVRPLDWEARTSGAATYVADLRLPGTLVGRVLRSPYPHARIRSIDTRAAARAPGVAAVITAADLPDRTYLHHGGALSDRYPLARDVVCFVGQEVAVVAAETRAQADAALALIRVRYQRLPAATNLEDALRPGAPRLRQRPSGTNVSLTLRRRYGDLAAAKARTAHAVSGRYRFNRQTHACMEPNSVLARWDGQRQRLELWVSTQSPWFVRLEVAHVLGLDMAQVVTHEVAVGGGFGSKSKVSEPDVLAAALALRTGRPVRIVLDREEEFAATKCRHDFDVTLASGLDADGRLTYREATIWVDNGAYNATGPSVMGGGSDIFGALYRLEAAHVDAHLVDTAKHPGGQFRGYGVPQATFAIESQLDVLAEAAGLDPLALRIRNANRPGERTLSGWHPGSARLVACLEAAGAAIGWETKRARGGTGRGVGIAAAIHKSGANVYDLAARSEAGIDVGADGRVTVRFASGDAGTGQRTVLAQVAADELGVDLGAVDVVTMESEATPLDMGAWSSRGTHQGGHAVAAAARTAAQALRRRAASKFGVSPEDVTLADGCASAGEQVVPIGDLVGMDAAEDALRVEGAYVADSERWDMATGVSNISCAYSFAAHAVEVEVDRETGEVRVLDYVAVHDSGTAINPTAAEGQITGGVAMGLGAALGEELIYEGGRLANPAYLDYAVPRAGDLPPIRALLVGEPDPAGPYGAKGIGEIALNPVAAAVANAVAHAIGVRITALPITPDKVLAVLQAAEGRRPHRFALARRPDRWWMAFMRWAYPRGAHALLHRWGTRLARRGQVPAIAAIERPGTIPEAVAALGAADAAPLGGGTDLLPARRQRLHRAARLIDLTTVPELGTIRETAGGDLRIGGAVTLAQLASDPATARDAALRTTIATIASAQVRELATVGGNLCQQKRCWFFRSGFDCYKRGGATCPCYAILGDHRFYHAAMDAHRCQAVTPSDLATTLLALDAEVTAHRGGGRRTLPIAGLYRGPGETVLARDEVLTEVRIPAPARQRATSFAKLRLWEGDFAVVAACVSLALDAGGVVTEARVVLGAMAPTPQRAVETERVLVGRPLTPDLVHAASEAWAGRAHPLPGNAWKIDAAGGLIRRCLREIRSP